MSHFRASMGALSLHLTALTSVLLWAGLGTLPGAQAAGSSDEYEEKARLIFSFARNSEWPKRRFSTPQSPFVIGIYGSDSISEFLREIVQTSRVKDRPVQVIYIKAKEQLRGCHILFVSRSERDRLRPIFTEVRREGVLTVGECDNFLAEGGVINFVNAGGSVGYQVKIANANEHELSFRGQLLQYARRPGAKSADVLVRSAPSVRLSKAAEIEE